MQTLVLQLASSTPDFWDFHYYGLVATAAATYASVKQLVGGARD
jgi:hypothetical protein